MRVFIDYQTEGVQTRTIKNKLQRKVYSPFHYGKTYNLRRFSAVSFSLSVSFGSIQHLKGVYGQLGAFTVYIFGGLRKLYLKF